jgi:predicted RNase H-like nuclease
VAAVLGLDACLAGWVGVLLDGTGALAGSVLAPYVAQAYDHAAVLAGGPLAAVGVDIPIGLPSSGPRQADLLAAKALGPRRSSVFATPVRAALVAPTHAEGSAINVAATGKGMSMQAYRLGPKVFDVDAWCRGLDVAVREVHPEVSFAELAGGPLPYPKKTWAGQARRRSLLRDAGVVLGDALGPADRVPVDDVLDAAVAAWTARRVALGTARSLPSPPEDVGDGWPAAIWV